MVDPAGPAIRRGMMPLSNSSNVSILKLYYGSNCFKCCHPCHDMNWPFKFEHSVKTDSVIAMILEAYKVPKHKPLQLLVQLMLYRVSIPSITPIKTTQLQPYSEAQYIHAYIHIRNYEKKDINTYLRGNLNYIYSLPTFL